MDVSVIVPFRNSQRWIGRCADSLLDQDYPRERYEVLFVDNESTDASAQIVQQRSRIRLLAESRRGSYAARNRGLAEARGRVIAFTDSDCAVDRNWVSAAVEALDDADVQIVQGRCDFGRSTLALRALAEYEHCRAERIFNGDEPSLYFAYTNNFATRRSVFDEFGVFEQRLRGADTLFLHRVLGARGCRAVRYCPAMRIRHMEITSAAAYWRKMLTYGRSHRAMDAAGLTFRSLDSSEKWAVYRRTVCEAQINVMQSAALLGTLGVGVAAWRIGRMSQCRTTGQPSHSKSISGEPSRSS